MCSQFLLFKIVIKFVTVLILLLQGVSVETGVNVERERE